MHIQGIISVLYIFIRIENIRDFNWMATINGWQQSNIGVRGTITWHSMWTKKNLQSLNHLFKRFPNKTVLTFFRFRAFLQIHCANQDFCFIIKPYIINRYIKRFNFHKAKKNFLSKTFLTLFYFSAIDETEQL